ncbi:MAG: excinuclease ABC subunit UvrA [Bacillota bacterium]|nr:excinuclease ABC subunit UvrA [Bacillota bacterium]
MDQKCIRIRGARANNLKSLDLDIPKHSIVVFTGVSGSGKSSLVFDTIAAEARRQLSDMFSAFARMRMPSGSAPDVDRISNLSAAVVVDQKRLGGHSRSTVGTVTDIYAVLRMLFSRVGQPYVGYSNAFSFNHPKGMCPECGGVGHIVEVDQEKMFDKTKSLNEGAILFPTYSVGSYYWKAFTCSGYFDCDKPLQDYTEEEWQQFLYGEGKFSTVRGGIPLEGNYEGVIRRFTRMFIQKGSSEISASTREKIEQYIRYAPCPACGGTRLNQAALSCRINGYNIAEMSKMEIEQLVPVLEGIDAPAAKPLTAELLRRLGHLRDIGLGYLTLERTTSSLSGGESQRIKMVKHLGSSLTDLLYIFDEPSVGLHAHDVEQLNRLFLELRDAGNTVLIVEHDPAVISIADLVVDMGPGAGSQGGSIVYRGDHAGLCQADTVTGRCLAKQLSLKAEPRQPRGWLPVRGACANNLRNLDLDFPQGVLSAVTGVAGSGKSSLIMEEFLKHYPEAVVIDQSPVGVNVRSNPATYTGVLDEIRKLFAKANGVSASLFSFNSQGACPDCQGLGYIYTDLAFMEPVRSLCENCQGRRFNDDVLSYLYQGKNISEVLNMTVREALAFFSQKKIREQLEMLERVGLEYLTLGQPLPTLSGGECQRLKLAGRLRQQGSVYVLDEPTTGLHISDTERLLGILDQLVDAGNTVIVIEHNLDVVRRADHVIDLGPAGGKNGGQLLYAGPPAGLLECPESRTGACLKQSL